MPGCAGISVMLRNSKKKDRPILVPCNADPIKDSDFCEKHQNSARISDMLHYMLRPNWREIQLEYIDRTFGLPKLPPLPPPGTKPKKRPARRAPPPKPKVEAAPPKPEPEPETPPEKRMTRSERLETLRRNALPSAEEARERLRRLLSE